MNPALHGSSALSNRMSGGASSDTVSEYESSSAPPPRAETMIIHFEVRDTGIGIEREKLKDMFKPFAQASASTARLYGGTGLGLCIVHRFVELLGGTIWVESEAGKGSAFHICSPLSLSHSRPASAESSPEVRLTARPAGGNNILPPGTSERGPVASSAHDLESLLLPNKLELKILLVEDNPINQKVASRQLQKHGHVVAVVGDGQQALDTVCARHDQFDLVLMDVQMPVMDGLAATEQIRIVEAEKGWSRLPILGLTAHAIQGYQNTCLVHGMDGYLGKPFDIQQLLKTLNPKP